MCKKVLLAYSSYAKHKYTLRTPKLWSLLILVSPGVLSWGQWGDCCLKLMLWWGLYILISVFVVVRKSGFDYLMDAWSSSSCLFLNLDLFGVTTTLVSLGACAYFDPCSVHGLSASWVAHFWGHPSYWGHGLTPLVGIPSRDPFFDSASIVCEVNLLHQIVDSNRISGVFLSYCCC